MAVRITFKKEYITISKTVSHCVLWYVTDKTTLPAQQNEIGFRVKKFEYQNDEKDIRFTYMGIILNMFDTHTGNVAFPNYVKDEFKKKRKKRVADVPVAQSVRAPYL